MKKIAIIPNSVKDVGLIQTKHIIECLRDKAEVYMPDKFSAIDGNVRFVEETDLYSIVDNAIVLGGDGTIIQSAECCAKKNVSVMGINMGTIGFLTEVELDNVAIALKKLLHDDYSIEERMMIKAEIIKNNELKSTCHALNDVVVSKTIEEKLIGIDLYTDGELVNKYVADGLIIATPTGSTGYSISAGGPVVDPNMHLYIATPICPHMLSARSAILNHHKVIEITIDETMHDSDAIITTDGEIQGYISSHDKIRLSKSKYTFKLIKTIKQSFYETLLNKLS